MGQKHRAPIDHNAPITVLYLGHTAGMDGAEIALLNLVTHIDTTHYAPVVVLGSMGPLYDALVGANIETHVLEMSPGVVQTRKDSLGARSLLRVGAFLHTLNYVWRLRRFIQQRRVQVIHANTLKADIMGGLAGRLARVPVIWHVRDRIADDYLPPLATHAFRWLCRIIPDFIITNSQATLETLQLPQLDHAAIVYSGGVSRAQVVHDGTLEQLKSPDVSPSKRMMVGLVGRISPWKGQHIFIEAAAAVRNVFPEACF